MNSPHDPREPSPADRLRERRGRHARPDEDDDSAQQPMAGARSDSQAPTSAPTAPRRARHEAPEVIEATTGDDSVAPGVSSYAEPASTNAPTDNAAASHSHTGNAAASNADASRAASVAQEEPASHLVRDAHADRDAQPASDAPADSVEARRRHAAEGSSFRVPKWMLAVAGAVVVGLVAWLIIGMATGGDDKSPAQSTAAASTSTKPAPVPPEALPQLLCMGSSYIVIETGKTPVELLADPKAIEGQFPGSKLSTIPPGCIAGSTERDQVVLAMGPYPAVDQACAAGKALNGVPFKAYAGSASTGLTETACP